MIMISIIVPIYKVELYLNRCVDSVLAQTYSNFELILVDDGSPDRCGEICDEYAVKDSRIRVIHKRNGGLADARNAGLEAAIGDYIAFVDSDDWVTPDYLEVMKKSLESTESDICECGIVRTSGNVFLPEVHFSQDVYLTGTALELLIQDHIFHQYVWNKLYKKECVSGISFPVGKINEDEFWTYQVFGNAHKITKISSMLYYYFQRENSIMGSDYNIRRLDALEAKCQRQMYIENKFPELSDTARLNLYSSCIYSGQMAIRFLKGKEQQKARKIIDDIQKKFRPGRREAAQLSGTERFWVRVARLNFWGLCRLKNFFRKGF